MGGGGYTDTQTDKQTDIETWCSENVNNYLIEMHSEKILNIYFLFLPGVAKSQIKQCIINRVNKCLARV